MSAANGGKVTAGFAKLKGEDWEYFMQSYSIILGRNSKKSQVDVDLAGDNAGMNISRQHARIYYDFQKKRFELEVLGKNGAYVEGVLHLPGMAPTRLESQNLIQIGEKAFYFLLPIKKTKARKLKEGEVTKKPSSKRKAKEKDGEDGEDEGTRDEEGSPPAKKKRSAVGGDKTGKGKGGKAQVNGAAAAEAKATSVSSDGDEEMEEEDEEASPTPSREVSGGGGASGSRAAASEQGSQLVRKRLSADDTEDAVLQAAWTVLSEQDNPYVEMPVAKLFMEITERHREVYAKAKSLISGPSEAANGSGEKARPWAGLSLILQRHADTFTYAARPKGRMVAEYVSLKEK